MKRKKIKIKIYPWPIVAIDLFRSFSVKKAAKLSCPLGQFNVDYIMYPCYRPECLWGILFKMATTYNNDCQEDNIGVKRGLKSFCEAKLSSK